MDSKAADGLIGVDDEADPFPARALVVLGMHRSGTSALTGTLAAMGAYAGAENELTGASWENRKGFFERRDMRQLCDNLLHEAGADWWKVSGLAPDGLAPSADNAAHANRFAALAEHLAAKAGPNGAWVLKEPRLCLLLNVLSEHLRDPVYLLSIRHPLEVAWSLRHRNGFPLEVGTALWEVYVCAALRSTAGRRQHLVHYADIVATPETVIRSLVEALEDFGVTGLNAATGIEMIDASMYRERIDNGPGEKILTPSQAELWQALRNGVLPDAPAPSAESVALLSRFEEDYMNLEAMRVELTKLRSDTTSAKKTESALRGQLATLLRQQRADARQVEQMRALLESQDAARGVQADPKLKLDIYENRVRKAIESKNAQIERTRHLEAEFKKESERTRQLEGELKKESERTRQLEGELNEKRERTRQHETELKGVSAEQQRVSIGQDSALEEVEKLKKELKRQIRKKKRARKLGLWLSSPVLILTLPISLPLSLFLMRRKNQRRSHLAPPSASSRAPASPSRPATSAPPTAYTAPRYVPRAERIAVYTAIIGGYDTLKFPEAVESDCDYICFTDTRIEDPGVWQIRGVDYFNPDPVRIARFVKTHPHIYLPEYDASVWIDGNLVLRAAISDMARAALDRGAFSAFVHPHRDCAYEEGREIKARGGLDDPGLVNQHLARLRLAGYPENAGLTETNVLVRRHNEPKVRAVNEAWWSEIANGSKRDQLSINYVAWKHGFEITPLADHGTSVRNDPRFERVLHLKDADTYTPSETARYFAHLRARPQLTDPYPHLLDVEIAREKAQGRSVDVVVCIHNSPKDVDACIASVHAARTGMQRIILVDDGSDEETQAVIKRHLVRHPDDLLIRHDTAQGYTRAANAGLMASSADYVVLLNSDTIVPEGWVMDLITSAERTELIGLIGPMSNAASWQSLPIVLTPDGDLAVNDLPSGMSVDAVSDLCSRLSDGRPILTPLVNGFCFAIKRAVIDRIGLFDEEAFPHGYGEENDYCLRAGNAGFSCAVSPSSYVFHAKSKSFTHERRRELSKLGSAAFRDKHPKSRIDNAIRVMKEHPRLIEMRAAFAAAIEEGPDRDDSPRLSAPGLVARDTAGAGSSQPPARKLPSNPLIARMDANPQVLRANEALISAFRAAPQTELRSATWFLPAITHIFRGGIYTVFRIADAFSRFGGTTNRFIILDSNANLESIGRQLEQEFPNLKFELDWIAEAEEASALPPSDAGFCTLWTTAYALLNFNRCAAKFYVIQDFEPLFVPAGSLSALIEQSYRFGFTGLCNTQGVAAKYSTYTDWLHTFTPGIDHFRFSPPVEKPEGVQLVFYGRPANDRNAFLLGIEALRRVKKALGDDISIVSAGHAFDESDYNLQGVLRNIGLLPTIDAVADLYRASHLGLVFMYTPHPSYQPLEFMATGCATLTNYNESTSWLLRDGENALLFPSTVSACADRIIAGVKDEALRHKVVQGGIRTAAALDWERELRAIFDYVRNPAPVSKGTFR